MDEVVEIEGAELRLLALHPAVDLRGQDEQGLCPLQRPRRAQRIEERVEPVPLGEKGLLTSAGTSLVPRLLSAFGVPFSVKKTER